MHHSDKPFPMDTAYDAVEKPRTADTPEHTNRKERRAKAAQERGKAKRDRRVQLGIQLESESFDQQFGATGGFPNGKLNDVDQGEIRFGVGSRNGDVIVNFGTPVSWFACTPTHARDLALILLRAADRSEQGVDPG